MLIFLLFLKTFLGWAGEGEGGTVCVGGWETGFQKLKQHKQNQEKSEHRYFRYEINILHFDKETDLIEYNVCPK